MIEEAMQIHPPVAPLERAQTGNVYPWHCDQWGHLNVQNYALWFAEAAAHALHRCGLGPSRLAELGATPFPRRQRVWYRKEFRLGEVAVTDAATIAGTGGPTVLARMREAISGAPATDCVMEMALHDAATLAPRDWPDLPSGLAAEGSLGEAAGLLGPWPVELPAGRLPGMRESLRGVVNTWDCDQHGTATTKRYFNAFSDAGLALMTGLQLDPKVLLEAGLSSAALGFYLVVCFLSGVAVGATVQVAPTHRAERDLPHQLAFLSDTDPKMRKLAIAGRARINPHWVAWMMGYERGWIMPDEDLTETTGVPGEWAWLHAR